MRSRWPRLALLALLALWFAGVGGAAAQTDGGLQALIELRVDAGYDGYFRELEWLPVRVRVVNNGPDVTGRLVVRPETSGEAITNTFSAPVVLPQGAQQTIFLYVTARTFADQVRVDLLTEAGAVLGSASDQVRAVRAGDRIAVAFTDAAVGAVDLSGAALGGFTAYQADWTTDELPSRAAALAGIDLMLFSDVDTGALTADQRTALADWVRAGGQLVVAGGAGWQATAAGLAELLPLRPAATVTAGSLAPLADWLRLDPGPLTGDNLIVATGALSEDAKTLVALEDGAPLLARRFAGNGVVDYLAADPNNAPLRGWAGLPDLWYTLETSWGSLPGWARGVENWAQAQQAVSIIPGVDPLPDILPLGLFLLVYVVVVGPVNYLILTRLNRREWAWLTIPLSIGIFSLIAWVVGSNLRGTEPILNRLTVVQAWPDEERAASEGLVGLLSPRRAQYTLETGVGDTLRPVPAAQTNSLLVRGAQSSVDIRQAAAFAAVNFAVDSSFVAGFDQVGRTASPAVGGSVTLAYDPAIPGQMVARGALRNDTGQTLRGPVVLARGTALQLADLSPGEVTPFELVLTGEGSPAPGPYLPSTITPYLTFRTARGQNRSDQTAVDILGAERFVQGAILSLATEADQRKLRDQLFISALVDDSFDSTGRGDRLFVAGWLDAPPLTTELPGQTGSERAATLVFAELATTIQPPSGVVTISADRFTWAVRAYAGLSEVTPVDLNMQPGEQVEFRFTPQPSAVLSDVQQMVIVVEGLNVAARRVPVYLYDWPAAEWVSMDIGRDGLVLDAPAPYLGPQNAVQIRLVADEIGGFLRIGSLGVEQRGLFRGA